MPRLLQFRERKRHISTLEQTLLRVNGWTAFGYSLPFTQTRQPVQTFRFLDLPAELRVEIYRFALSDAYGSVDRHLEHHMEVCALNKRRPQDLYPPRLTTPPILLINRQIYLESLPILHRQPLTLTHGLLGFHLSSLITYETIRNVRHMIVTDDGHNPVDNSIWHNFDGFRAIASEVADALYEPGHKLKKLELKFENPNMAYHERSCWRGVPGGGICGMRAYIESVHRDWKTVRGISSVSVTGWYPRYHGDDLKRLMVAPYNPLTLLPETVRNKIYHYSANWNNVNAKLGTYTRAEVLYADNADRPVLFTPTIALLDKRTTHEYKFQMTRTVPLKLVFRQNYNPHQGLYDYINPLTLRTVKHLHIYIKHWHALTVLPDIVNVLMIEKYRSLHTLRIHFCDSVLKLDAERRAQYYPAKDLLEMFLPLTRLREIPKVRITGALPRCFSGPLQETMMDHRDSRTRDLFQRCAAPKTRVVKGNGWAYVGAKEAKYRVYRYLRA